MLHTMLITKKKEKVKSSKYKLKNKCKNNNTYTFVDNIYYVAKNIILCNKNNIQYPMAFVSNRIVDNY